VHRAGGKAAMIPGVAVSLGDCGLLQPVFDQNSNRTGQLHLSAYH